MSKTIYTYGIMLNNRHLFNWQLKTIQLLEQTGLVSCRLIIIKKKSEGHSTSFFRRIFKSPWLFENYKKAFIQQHVYKQVEIPHWLKADLIETEVISSSKNTDTFPNEVIEKIKTYQLHFMLRFGFGILKGNILNVAQWGIWSFHHGDEQEFRGGPPGYWEIMKSVRKQGVILQQLTEKLDAGKLILKREYSIIRHSYKDNVYKLLFQSADMPAQAVKMIHADIIKPGQFESISTQAPIYKYPTNFQFLVGLTKLLFNKIKFKYYDLFKQENWVVGLKKMSDEKYSFISSAKTGTYYADPFIIQANGNACLLAEYYSYSVRKGSIVMLSPHQPGHKVIIDKDTHLSYPFVFHDSGVDYIIPEEGSTGKLNIYKWNPSTCEAEFIQTLINIPAIDPSIIKVNDVYYLFTGIQGELPNEKLFIYYAENLFGPYHPHVCNPVKVSPHGTRMAGAIFDNGIGLIRPSQSSIKSYGEKVILQRIEQLSTTRYKEVKIDELKPVYLNGFNDGLHTYHQSNNYTAIDVKRMQSDFKSFISRLT